MRLKPESCLRVTSTHSRSACHHLSTLQSPHILVSSSRCWQVDRLTGLSRIYISCHELSNLRIIPFTRIITEYHGFIYFVMNYRICELFSSHGLSRSITDLYILSRIIEFANYHLSHGMSRNVTDYNLICHEI